MVPDRQQIIRVKLYAQGFETADVLAAKFFQLYQLASEQLSQQRHYDWGLRNILSVLRACGNQLRESHESGKDESESEILMRVLIDMNKSKLVDEDINLFINLVKDLFPNERLQQTDHLGLKEAIIQSCEELQLCWQDPDQILNNSQEIPRENEWFKSVQQLYETQLVRHGIMILGPPQSGKSQTIYTLAKALTKLSNNRIKYQVIKLNPKAITNGQLFGILHQATNDWTDGVFSSIFRKCCQTGQKQQNQKQTQETVYFITFDGPVDAQYIENMNSLLDDSKVLTLANSDRIPMSNNIKLIFEVDSLENASPATVSRAGMIYMPGFKYYGWKMLYISWTKQWPEQYKKYLNKLLISNNFIDKIYQQLDIQWHPIINIPQLCYMKNFLQILTSLIFDGSDKESEIKQQQVRDLLEEALQQAQTMVQEGYVNYQQSIQQNIANACKQRLYQISQEKWQKLIIYSLINSFGSTLEGNDEQQLYKMIYQLAQENNIDMPFQNNNCMNLKEYYVNQQGKWTNFIEMLPNYNYPETYDPEFNQILIPTLQNTALKYLLTKLSDVQFNILLVGESGSSKTQIVNDWLIQRQNNFKNTGTSRINMSYATTTQIMYNTIHSFIEKKQGTIFGPKNQQTAIIFIDDINIPEINEWGDQPTNEFIRQSIEERGFYNLQKPGEFITITDFNFIACMPTPAAGKNDIPNRLKSQFIIQKVGIPSDDTIEQIYQTIVQGHFDQQRGFSEQIIQLVQELVPLTRIIWNQTKQKFLPTPQKFHYVFNMRDLSRIFQGLIKADSISLQTQQQLIHLWLNEIFRSISDKFINLQDIKVFTSMLLQIVNEESENDLIKQEAQIFTKQILHECDESDSELKDNEYYYFVNFMKKEQDSEEENESQQEEIKLYEEINSKQQLVQRLTQCQQQYNEDSINKHSNKLEMVFFDSCIQHIVRINRIITTPRQHALLVGIGGSGKTSCAKLASYIANYKIEQLRMEKNYDIQQLDEDIKRIYKLAGLSKTGVSFIIQDSDIKEERFLERINNLLTLGSIPALYTKEEQDEICNLIIPQYRMEHMRGTESVTTLWNYFISNATNKLHIILLFSPIGDKFSSRAKKFPGIINCTIIDWFHPWSQKAMTQVAESKISKFQLQNVSQQCLQIMPEIFSYIHESTNKYIEEYFNIYRKLIYITPQQYMSFLYTFEKLYHQKLQDLVNNKTRLSNGLLKLQEAQEQIAKMKLQLQKEQQVLAVSQAEVNEKMKVLSEQKREAESIAQQIEEVVKECAVKEEIVKQKTQIALEVKKKAEPAKIAAEQALNKITANDISNLLALSKPKSVIQRIFDMVMIFLYEKVDKVQLDKDYTNIDNAIQPSWENHTKSVITKAGFLQRLQNFNKDGVTDEQCELVQAYILRQIDMMDDVAASKAFKQVVGLNGWARCLVEYHKIMINFMPIQNQVNKLTKELQQANQAKLQAQQQLDQKLKALEILQKDFDIVDAHRQQLEDQANTTKRRLNVAESLINGLRGERERWQNQIQQIDTDIVELVGTSLLAAGFLSYSGPFNWLYRINLTSSWLKKIKSMQIPYRKHINTQMIEFLASQQQIATLRLNGLPSDEQSTQNALIMHSSTRYVLFIDPQSQALNFLKKAFKDAIFVKQTDQQFKQIIEDAIQDGKTVVIEDIDNYLDPSLYNILSKTTFKQGRGLQIEFNNKNISFNPQFNLFITTRLQRPVFTPEVYSKTCVVDFSVTYAGLQQQLLARAVSIERPELEEQKQKLIKEIQQNKIKLIDLENDLLLKLSSTKGNILDDESLINVLNQTKQTTQKVKAQLQTANDNNVSIDQQRSDYIPVSYRGADIYFTITEFTLVNTMYQTSLNVFLNLFDQAILSAAQSNISQKRINNVVENITKKTFKYITRGLYEQHKQLFALDLAIKIDLNEQIIGELEFMIFIRAGALLTRNEIKQKPQNLEFLSDQVWSNIQMLSICEYFEDIVDFMTQNSSQWYKFYMSDRAESDIIPNYQELNEIDQHPENRFKRLLVIRCLREDRTMLAAQQYIQQRLGKEYTEPSNNDYKEIITKEQNSATPLIFLLSLGSDPTNQLLQIAKREKINCDTISMGQGQENKATDMIMKAQQNGGWIIINNCHLTINYMTTIQQIMDQFKKQNKRQINQQFRLILTAEPNDQFPISLLQESIKLTNDLPSGMRAGLMRTYNNLSQDVLDSIDKPKYWLPLIYSLAYLHSVVIERKKYGTLGWCTKYEFGDHDFNSSLTFIQNYIYGLDYRKKPLNELISYQTIQYMISEIYYGGRITDDFDRRLMNVYTQEYLNANIFTQGFSYGQSLKGEKLLSPYYQDIKKLLIEPQQYNYKSIEYIRNYINNLPSVDTPKMYYMNQNADMAFRRQETMDTLNALLNMQPKDAISLQGKSREQTVQDLAAQLLQQLHQDYQLKTEVKEKLKKNNKDVQRSPLNIFLEQEIIRIQKLLSKVRKDLREVIQAVDGTIVMSDELNQIINSLYDAKVPDKWLQLSFQYDNLSSWINHLQQCCIQYDNWLNSQTCELPAYWINGFFNPTGFITSIKQTISRKKKISLDNVQLKYTVGKRYINSIQEAMQLQSNKQQFIIYGLYLEGAQWSINKEVICDQKLKQLQYNMPVIIIEMETQQDMQRRNRKYYQCPVYMTPKRTALTYITTISLPCEKNENYWILQGTALLCQKE